MCALLLEGHIQDENFAMPTGGGVAFMSSDENVERHVSAQKHSACPEEIGGSEEAQHQLDV